MRGAVASLVLLLALTPATAMAKSTRFWNLTAHTITSLRLSPPGANAWGADQAANDPDGAVDHDERLNLKGVASGLYDLKLIDKTGRTCVVRDVRISEGAVFSIEEKQLGDCSK